jgi:hypothetical protein
MDERAFYMEKEETRKVKSRKRFELTGQSTVLINDDLGDPNADPENFGNR